MAIAALGTTTATSIATQYIMPTFVDNVYKSNVVLYRLIKNNKRIVSGGTQIEIPLLMSRFNSGGAYSGFDPLNTTPSDTVRTAAWAWKQQYVTWAIDGLTLLKVDTPAAIANILMMYAQQATMEMAENLAAGLFGDGLGVVTSTKDIDGMLQLFNTAANYGTIRTANSWFNPTFVGGSGVAMTLAALQSGFGTATVGGQHPTLFMSGQDQYNRFWALGYTSSGSQVTSVREPGGADELLLSAGFTNLLFNNVPWVVDSHVPLNSVLNGAGGANSMVIGLNENFVNWVVSERGDFLVQPFVEMPNQDAMVSKILFAGNLAVSNCATQLAITNFTS